MNTHEVAPELTTDIGNGLVHFRHIGTDLPTPCGIQFTDYRQTLTLGGSTSTITCPICLAYAEQLIAKGGRSW